jgi:hypothetical protein
MSHRPTSLLPLTILQLVQRTLSQLIGSSASLFPRALPTSLVGLVPDCTANCLESFISTNYQASRCSTNLDLTCLCTHITPSGLTIGEAALQCLISSCPSKDAVDESSVYNICSAIPNAIPETVGTITITMTSTNFISVTTLRTSATAISSILPSSILIASTSLSDIGSIVSDTGTPSIPVPQSSMAQTTTTSSASVTQPAAQTTSSLTNVAPLPSQQATLTTGEIVGIAVGGGAAACFAFGVLVFILCFRRRKRQRRRSARLSMAIEKPPPRPSTPSQNPVHARTTFADPADLTIGHGQRYYAAPPVEEKRRSFWRRSIKPEDIGVAVSPKVGQNDSPDSFSSQRTASQLLPALPNYALWPAPLRLSRQLPTTQGVMRPESTATVFEEDVGREMDTYKAVTLPEDPSDIGTTEEMAQRAIPLQIGSRPPIDPRAQMYALERATVAAIKSPITLTPVYDNGVNTPVYDKLTSASTIPGSGQAFTSILPQPYYSSSFAQDPRRTPPPQANVIHPRSLQKYSSAPNLPRNQQQQHPRSSASTPSLSATTSYTDKRSTAARKGSIDSAGSDVTTFDTDEDTTPEQEFDKRLKPSTLSPVMESPARPPATFGQQGSPIKDLQYPRVPRPAAIARQAERAPRPRAALQINTTGPQPQPPRMAITRDQLVHDERSFLQSQTSTRASPEPTSSLLTKSRGDKAGDQMLQGVLKLSSDSANRAAPKNRKWEAWDPEEQPLQSPRRPKLVLDTQSPSVENGRASKRTSVGLTPTRRGGDLFLTVH